MRQDSMIDKAARAAIFFLILVFAFLLGFSWGLLHAHR